MFDTRRLKLAIAAVGMASGPGALAQTAPGTTHAAPARIDTAQQQMVIDMAIEKLVASADPVRGAELRKLLSPIS